MSASPPYSNYFRCRTIGRAASPPAVICYEQIPYDDDDYSESCSDSCSEDDEDYPNDAADNEHNNSDSQDEEGARHPSADDPNDLDMDIDEEGAAGTESGEMQSVEPTKDIKGKQRAIVAEPEPEPPKRRHHRRKQRHNTFTLRPILTIQRSQGFVWNQVSISSTLDRFAQVYLPYRIFFYLRIYVNDVRQFTFLHLSSMN